MVPPCTGQTGRVGARGLLARGRRRAGAVFRRAQPRRKHRPLQKGSGLAVVEHVEASRPVPPPALAPYGEVYPAVASARPYLSPLAVGAVCRHHPRQDPDAVMPHVRIRGGGDQRWSFLLRLQPARVDSRI